MKYSINKKNGIVCAIIQIHESNCTVQNVILDFNIDKLRKRIGNFIKTQIKKIKPEGNMVGWQTSIGDFTIYKELAYDNWDIWKSKYRYTDTKLEFAPKKGEITHKTLTRRKNINPEYEGLGECEICNKIKILENSVDREGKIFKCCKKCKDFDKLLDKISKEIDAKEQDSVCAT